MSFALEMTVNVGHLPCFRMTSKAYLRLECSRSTQWFSCKWYSISNVNSSLRVQSGGGGDVVTELIKRLVSMKKSLIKIKSHSIPNCKSHIKPTFTKQPFVKSLEHYSKI